MYSLAKNEKLPEHFHTSQPRCIAKDVHRMSDEPVHLQDAISPDASARVWSIYHYLIVEVAEVWHPEGRRLNGFYLRAEKVGQDDQGEDGNDVTAGIAVKNVAIPQDAEEHYRVLDLSVSILHLVDISWRIALITTW